MIFAEYHQQTFKENQRVLPPAGSAIETREAARPVSDPVMDFARQRGLTDAAGNTDLSGLILRQQNLNAEGAVDSDLTYVVNQRVVARPQYENTGKRRWGLPWNARREGTTKFLHENLGAKRRVLSKNPKLTSVVDLEVYDQDGKVISEVNFTSQKEFLAFLDSHDELDARKAREADADKRGHGLPAYLVTEEGNSVLPRGPIVAFDWAKERPKAAGELVAADRRHIPISLSPNTKLDVLDQVFRDRERLNLPGGSLVGLTFESEGHVFQVTGEKLVASKDPSDLTQKRGKSARKFEITQWELVTDEHGRQTRREARRIQRFLWAEGLQEELNQRKFTDLHWELSKAEARDAEQAILLGRAAVRKGSPRTRPDEFVWTPDMGSRHLSLDEAFEVLSYPELYDLYAVDKDGQPDLARRDAEQQRFQAHVEALKQQPVANELAQQLQEIIQRYGTTRVNEVAEQIRDDYVRTAALLGLSIPETKKASVSWVLRDLVEQYYFSQNPNQAGAVRQTDAFGIEVGNPFGRPREARRKQREIVNYRLGLATIDGAIKPQLGNKSKIDVKKGGKLKSTPVGVPGYKLDDDFLRELGVLVPKDHRPLQDRKKLPLRDIKDVQQLVEDIIGAKEEHIKRFSDNKELLEAFRAGKDVETGYRPDPAVLARIGLLLRAEVGT